MEKPAGAKTGPGPRCVLLTWSDKNQSACLLSEMGRGGSFIDAFFLMAQISKQIWQ